MVIIQEYYQDILKILSSTEVAQASSSSGVANREFLPEAQGELELKIGDLISINHDPDQEKADIHRWVHGINERSQERGWFPLSYTRAQ